MPGYRRNGELNPGQSVTTAADHPGQTFYRGQWISDAEWQRLMDQQFGWNWQKTLAVAAPFLAGGVGALAGAGGSAAAAGSAIPSLPAAVSGVPAGLGATVGAGAGSGAAAAAGGAGMGFGIKDAVQLGPLLAGLFKGGHEEPPQNDAMNALIDMQTQRLKQSDPLYQAILRMAMGLVPRNYQSALPQATAQPRPTAVRRP